MTKADIPNTLKIRGYIHCGKCINDYKTDPAAIDLSPKDYQRIQAGWTKLGLQIWCTRHDCNIVHIDFEGKQLPANITAELP